MVPTNLMTPKTLKILTNRVSKASDAVRSEVIAGRSQTDIVRLQNALVGWYEANRRALPWRGVEDPYAVWVSEIMLQQTRVATVIDYFERWMVRFPDVRALARASLDDVLEAWAGLGYYRRARALHAGAKIVVDEFGGQMPDSVKGLRTLPGIGAYTAGAIASIAFGQPEPLVDGNVERVLSRLWALAEDAKSSRGSRRLWKLAGEILDRKRPASFNQALMELGALICMPQNPRCEACPLQAFCDGFMSGNPSAYPPATVRIPQKAIGARTAIVFTGNCPKTRRYLIVQRPHEGLLAGLWEFPTLVSTTKTIPDGAALSLYLRQELGAPLAADAVAQPVGKIVHHFTHIKMTIAAESRQVDSEDCVRALAGSARFVDLETLNEVAMSAAMRKLQKLLDEA